MSKKDDGVVELLRECASSAHGLAQLRRTLGVSTESGWQQRCLAEVADMLEAELEAEREEAAFWEAQHDVELNKRINAEQRTADMERTHMKLPVDRNGEVLHIGDEVWFHDELDADPRIVLGHGMTNLRDVDVLLNHADEGWCPNTMAIPDVLVNRKPETVESLLAEFENHVRCDGADDASIAEFAERIRKAVEHGD